MSHGVRHRWFGNPATLSARVLLLASLVPGCGDGRKPMEGEPGHMAQGAHTGGTSIPVLVSPMEAEIQNVSQVFHLDYPFQLTSWDYYLDGGTLAFTVSDVKGTTAVFCLDQSIRNAIERPGKPGFFYFGADYPTRPGARKLEMGGVEERAVLDLLQLVAAPRFSRSLTDSMAEQRSLSDYLVEHPEITIGDRWALQAGILAWQRRCMVSGLDGPE